MSSPPKMFGRDSEREPSEEVVSWPPKMFGRDEECPSGVVQSWPPKMFGRQETCAIPTFGSTNTHAKSATPSATGCATAKGSRRSGGTLLLSSYALTVEREYHIPKNRQHCGGNSYLLLTGEVLHR